MSTNCLVTKLKESVNAELPILNKFVFNIAPNVTTTNQNFGIFYGNGNTIVKLTGTVHLVNESNIQVDSDRQYLVPNDYVNLKATGGAEGGKVIVDKYIINNMMFTIKPEFDTPEDIMSWYNGDGTTADFRPWGAIDTSIFRGYHGLTIIRVGANSTGSLSDFTDSLNTLTNITIPGTKIAGNILTIAHSGLKNIQAFNCPNISGNISSFGVCTDIREINMFNSPLEGSIEDFVRQQVSNGRTSVTGNILEINCSTVTFKGGNVGAAHQKLNWTTSGSNIHITFGSEEEDITL